MGNIFSLWCFTFSLLWFFTYFQKFIMSKNSFKVQNLNFNFRQSEKCRNPRKKNRNLGNLYIWKTSKIWENLENLKNYEIWKHLENLIFVRKSQKSENIENLKKSWKSEKYRNIYILKNWKSLKNIEIWKCHDVIIYSK